MKNFLQVLLVGTILVSAGDGFAYESQFPQSHTGFDNLGERISGLFSEKTTSYTAGGTESLGLRAGEVTSRSSASWAQKIYDPNGNVVAESLITYQNGQPVTNWTITDAGKNMGLVGGSSVSYTPTGSVWEQAGFSNYSDYLQYGGDINAYRSAQLGSGDLLTPGFNSSGNIPSGGTGGVPDATGSGGGAGSGGNSGGVPDGWDAGQEMPPFEPDVYSSGGRVGDGWGDASGAADLTGESFTDYGSHGSFSSVSGTRLEAQLDGTYLDPATNYTYTVENGSLVRVGGSGAGSGSGWDYSNVEGGDGFDWGNAGPGNQGGSGASGTDWDNLDTDSPHLYGDDVASGGSGGGAALGSGAGVSGDALGGISQGIAGSIGAGLSNVGATFGNYFDTLTGTLTKPFSIIKGLWDDAGGTIGAALGSIKEGFVQLPGNVKAIFGAGDKILSGTSAVDSLLKAQGVDASKLTAKQQAALATKIAQAFPILIWNYGEYATVIMQTLEAGKQNDTTKEVKVKAEKGLLASQGASTDSTVGENVSLQGTNLASAASQMALLLDANPVDLNLLKTNDLDLKKDKDQKTLRQRRDLLLQMYATSAQIIAEGSNDISENFYERIKQLSESLPDTVGSLGSASVLNDSERYPYFEMIRQTALTATQLGLKGASILPNLRIVAPKSQEQ